MATYPPSDLAALRLEHVIRQWGLPAAVAQVSCLHSVFASTTAVCYPAHGLERGPLTGADGLPDPSLTGRRALCLHGAYAPNGYGKTAILQQLVSGGAANNATLRFTEYALNRALHRSGYEGDALAIGQCVHLCTDKLPAAANTRDRKGDRIKISDNKTLALLQRFEPDHARSVHARAEALERRGFHTLDVLLYGDGKHDLPYSPPRIEPLARTGSWLCRAYNTGPHVLISFARLLHSHRLWSKVQANLKHLKINVLKSDATREGCHHFECICHPESNGYHASHAKGIDTILTHAFTPLAHRLGVDMQRFRESCDYFHAMYTKSGGLSEEDQKLVCKLGGEARQRAEKAGIGKPNHFRDTQAASDAGSPSHATPRHPTPSHGPPSPSPTPSHTSPRPSLSPLFDRSPRPHEPLALALACPLPRPHASGHHPPAPPGPTSPPPHVPRMASMRAFSHTQHCPVLPLLACSGEDGSGWHQASGVVAARDAKLPANFRHGSVGAFDFTKQFLLKCTDEACTRTDLVHSHGFPVGVFPGNKEWDDDTQQYVFPLGRKLKCGKHTAPSGGQGSRKAVRWTPPQPSTGDR